MRDDAADQVFLSREVVMQRRDIHADARRDLAGAQTLEAPRRDDLECCSDQRIFPRFGLSAYLTFNQSDD